MDQLSAKTVMVLLKIQKWNTQMKKHTDTVARVCLKGKKKTVKYEK